ncbi:MAG: SDR family NAD(P)-dependent oxidoreductase [Myxococcota bacterium]
MADFATHYGPWAIVAGASEGIGAAFCDAIAAHGVNLVMIARRTGPLETTADRLREVHGIEVRTVSADLGTPDVGETLAPHLEALDVGLLVYNACASTVGNYLETSLSSKLASVNVNCAGPLHLLALVQDRMVERGRGGVILMSSLSGVVGTAMVATYAATKAYTQILGEGLWEELGPHGIDVLVSAPGATRTPNWEAVTPEHQWEKAFPLTAADVATQTLARLGRGPVMVPGRLNGAVFFVMSRLLGRRAAIRFMSANTRAIYAG